MPEVRPLLDTNMKRGGYLRRHTRLRNRGGRLFPKLKDDAYSAHVRGLPCTLSWTKSRLPPNRDRFVGPKAVACFGGTEPHHVEKKGHGGPDRANEVPLCAGHHRQQENVGRETFEALYSSDGVHLNLAAVARRLWEEYEMDRARRGVTEF